MIWNEELSASLDQSSGVVVFHHVDMSRVEQLTLTLAERVNTLVEQNEKALDVKQGNQASWGDRAEGIKGEKRSEQTQERKGRSERTRGAARGSFKAYIHSPFSTFSYRQHSRRSRGTICARSRESHGWHRYCTDDKSSLKTSRYFLHDLHVHALLNTL